VKTICIAGVFIVNVINKCERAFEFQIANKRVEIKMLTIKNEKTLLRGSQGYLQLTNTKHYAF
jgi:hypothetical protein